jgi:peptide/nickel transport system ATP-binding protein
MKSIDCQVRQIAGHLHQFKFARCFLHDSFIFIWEIEMNLETLLRIKNLTVGFPRGSQLHTAVDAISFDVKSGETVGIVGESGSGKSLTALSVMQLLPLEAIRQGEIFYRGKDNVETGLMHIPEKQKRTFRGKEIGMIFQEPSTALNPVLTCGSQVAEVMMHHLRQNRKEAFEHSISLFEKVMLPDARRIFHSYPHQLSGGQKQRVMIAMAICCKPNILIADEPTSSLDVTVQSHILALLEMLRAENNMSMIFISHDLGVIAEIADRVVVMYKGKIVEQGDVMQIFSNPVHPYTKGLLACRPPLYKKLRRLPVIEDFMLVEKNNNAPIPQNSFSDIDDALIISAVEVDRRLQHLQQHVPVLSVKNLRTYFSYRKNFFSRKTLVAAVDDVSFDLYPGETLGLVGESGSGKTTLARSILQLIQPASGTVLFEGRDLAHSNEKEMRAVRKKMQIIFQDPYGSLNPGFTAGHAITEPMRVHHLYGSEKGRMEKARQLLSKVKLPADAYNRFPHEFSGGQRQRISIARALAVEPKFLICDEPVSALDVSVQAQVLNMLLQLQEEFNLTYIFISHDLSVVQFMSDRIMVMNKGKIEETGKAADICQRPATQYTKELISAVPAGSLESIRYNVEKRKKSAVTAMHSS